MIEDCLQSILALEHQDMQVLVIDQSTDDTTRRSIEAVAKGDKRVSVIPTDTVGVAVARNIALQATASEVLAFVDDDCHVETDWLDAILREFVDHRVVAVFGRIVPPGFKTRGGTEVAFKESADRAEYHDRVPPWHVGHGASMSVRRSALVEMGGFDELLGAGAPLFSAEDLDIAYRFVSAGGWLVYTGAAVTYHKAWRDWPSRRRIERGYGIGAGAAFMKYLRCGDAYGAKLFATWMWELGVRRVGAGLLKWRSTRPMYLGYCQLVYPWIGAVRSLRLRIDRDAQVFVGPTAKDPLSQSASPG
jgi:cellulose synthase/poly-beta-1,6-N-acetylglucosamine synthase-like glycosyltransferase